MVFNYMRTCGSCPDPFNIEEMFYILFALCVCIAVERMCSVVCLCKVVCLYVCVCVFVVCMCLLCVHMCVFMHV